MASDILPQASRRHRLDRWSHLALRKAREVSLASKDPGHRVGCVIVRPDRTVAGEGYNGLARGVLDSPERLSNREVKLALTIHAEQNAVLNSRDPSMVGYHAYVYPLHPCANCASVLVQKGIRFVTAVCEDAPRWAESFRQAQMVMTEAGVIFRWVDYTDWKQLDSKWEWDNLPDRRIS